jgi:dipeptidyl aminopeptidase/acylaminoacyl peptidase
MPQVGWWGGFIVAPLIYNRTTGKTTSAVEPASTLQQPTWIEDGRNLAWLEHVLYSAASRKPRKGIPVGGLFSELTILKTGELRQNRVIHSHVLLDEHALVQPGLPVIWNAHDHALFVGLSKLARDSVYAVDVSTGARHRITPKQFHVLNYDISGDGKQWAAILTNANTPSEVYVGDINGGGVRKLTDFGDKLAFQPAKVLPVHWRSGDGRFDVHGWLVTPPNYDPSKRYPMVVDCHGGPAGTIRDDFWTIQTDNVPPTILASHGYLVLLPNPRGDPGYSVEYTKALVGHLMTGDVDQDILPGVDAMVAAGVADPNRLAITGFSAGATRTAWAIAHTNRFKAASLSDGVMDFLSYWGQALPYNTGWIDFYLEGTPNTRIDDYIKRSPITYAYRIQTPTLMRYANNNAELWDTPATPQGKELQAMLYMKGVPTDIQIEPHAPHGPRTLGALQLWVDANLAWFDHYVLRLARDGSCPALRVGRSEAKCAMNCLPRKARMCWHVARVQPPIYREFLKRPVDANSSSNGGARLR